MKKIVVAVDSFKGSLDAWDVAEAVARGIHDVDPRCCVVTMPLADGGEGTAQTLARSGEWNMVDVRVSDPLMRPVATRYAVSADRTRAVMDLASASGLTLISDDKRNPMITTTYGLGEMILDALDRGVRDFVVGIGGSATNDAGVGMLQALGYRFIDREGHVLDMRGGMILNRIASIDSSAADLRLAESTFEVACDVTNPFYGESGAASVFAPQKGATPDQVSELDCGLRNFAQVLYRFTGVDVSALEGSGAAGGVGGAFVAILSATLRRGVELMLKAVRFDEHIADASLVITGEGSMDAQTLMGKLPFGVLNAASSRGVAVVAVAGAVRDAEILRQAGFAAVFSIQPYPVDLERAMQRDFACRNIRETVSQIVNMLNKMSGMNVHAGQ